MKKNLRIAINAQIPSASGSGGLETVLRILTTFGQLEGDEEYIFIGHHVDSEWLKPLLGERQTLVSAPMPMKTRSNGKESLKRLASPLLPFARKIKKIVSPTQIKYDIPHSNGFYESLNCDVIHFPYQDYVYCDVPTVYNPHDLQHLHYPEFFTPAEIERRESIYPSACRAADFVVVGSQFVKNDVRQKYKIDSDKIQIIPWSLPEKMFDVFTEKDAQILLEKYKCPSRPFIIYPAMTWEHKNHIRLLEAIALLRERDNLEINLICTGHKNHFYAHIKKRLIELNLEDQVKFTGIVEYEELSILYRLAQFVIIPTLFEAASGPLFEAWQHDVAATCSTITSLPEQAGDAALLFDPFSVEEIADSIMKLAADETFRAELRVKGKRRLRDFDIENTVKAYRAVYKKAAGIALDEEEKNLLNRDSMSDYHRK
ncbi:MAG: glycosyltransferase family 4 protein [Aridibacter sp.]